MSTRKIIKQQIIFFICPLTLKEMRKSFLTSFSQNLFYLLNTSFGIIICMKQKKEMSLYCLCRVYSGAISLFLNGMEIFTGKCCVVLHTCLCKIKHHYNYCTLYIFKMHVLVAI